MALFTKHTDANTHTQTESTVSVVLLISMLLPMWSVFAQQLRSLATSDESVVGHGLRGRFPDAATAAIPDTNCLFLLINLSSLARME